MKLDRLVNNEIENETIVAEMTFGEGDILNATIRPLGASSATLLRLSKVSRLANDPKREQDYLEEMLSVAPIALSQWVVSWDLQYIDGSPMPATPEAIADIPFHNLRDLFLAVKGVVDESPKEPSTSSGKPTNTGGKRQRRS
jgi:hypothetical protein